jgi:hypothetical protein
MTLGRQAWVSESFHYLHGDFDDDEHGCKSAMIETT